MKKVDLKSCYGKIFIPTPIVEAKRAQTKAQRDSDFIDFLYFNKRRFELDAGIFLKEYLKELQKKEI